MSLKFKYLSAMGVAIASAILSAMTPTISAGDALPDETAKVYYPRGHRYYYPSYLDNGLRMSRFIKSVQAADSTGILDHIEVRAYASPDGSKAANSRLTVNRCNELVTYLEKHTGLSPELIVQRPEGIAWDELYALVEADASMPYRTEVLDVLANTPEFVTDDTGRVVGGRKKSLMDLRGGRPYNRLMEKIFPQLRNAVAVTLFVRSEEPDSPATATESVIVSTEATADEKHDSSDRTTDLTTEYGDKMSAITDETTDETPASVEETSAAETVSQNRDIIHAFALKTNLIYDAALCPNLAFEWRINDRWSVQAEADVAWWKNDNRHRFYQIMYLGGEGRYWFSQRSPWHGFYVGAMAGGGKYDLSRGHRGYKGEAGLGGITCGFMFPISRHLSFDAEIGVGYLYTKYQEYIPYDEHYIYQQTARSNYFGPVKAQFSLVWRFGDSAKIMKGGRK